MYEIDGEYPGSLVRLTLERAKSVTDGPRGIKENTVHGREPLSADVKPLSADVKLVYGQDDIPAVNMQAWIDYGFTADEVAEWMTVDCFCPEAASKLHHFRIFPTEVASRVDRFSNATLGYCVANNAISADDLDYCPVCGEEFCRYLIDEIEPDARSVARDIYNSLNDSLIDNLPEGEEVNLVTRWPGWEAATDGDRGLISDMMHCDDAGAGVEEAWNDLVEEGGDAFTSAAPDAITAWTKESAKIEARGKELAKIEARRTPRGRGEPHENQS